MEEIWKDIEGYYGLYQISNKGRVKSLGNDRTRKEKILKPCKNKNGYLKVVLSKEGTQKGMTVHRLVADAFIPNPYNLPQVNHINECKTDNRVENLEFCTQEYNLKYGSHNERCVKSNINNPKRSKKVICVESGKIYPSASEVKRQLGFSKCSISACCRGKLKVAYKLHWKYVD